MGTTNLKYKPNLPESAVSPFGELVATQPEPYTGWTFGYNINPTQVSTIEVLDGTVTYEDPGSFAKVDSGTTAGSAGVLRTIGAITYNPGMGARVIISAKFSLPQEGCQQIIGAINSRDGWGFGYNGLKFGVLRRSNSSGVIIDEWVYQEDWNLHTRTGLNPQKLNVYEVRFQWLGAGMQYFGIEQNSGNIEYVHKLVYANRNDDVSVAVPNLPIAVGASTLTGTATPVSIWTPSAACYALGEAFPETFTTLIGYSYFEAVVVGSNYLFSILNPGTYESKDNRLYLEGALITCSNGTNKEITITVLFNTVLTDPVWTDISTGITPAQADEVATAYTNGLEIASFTVPRLAGVSFDLTSILKGAKQWAETTITFVAEVTLAGDVTIGYTFRSRI